MNNFIPPEIEWSLMSPEEKASVLFPDMTTAPLTDAEKEHLKRLFDDDLQNRIKYNSR